MHLCEIEPLAVGQDGSGPSPVAEGQLPARPRIRSLGEAVAPVRLAQARRCTRHLCRVEGRCW